MRATKGKTKSIPWWASVITAIVVYCLLKYILPNLNPADQGLRNIFQFGPTAAPVVTIPFLLLAAKQLYDNPTTDTEDNPQKHKYNAALDGNGRTTPFYNSHPGCFPA